MIRVKIIKPGLQTTIQDNGRHGFAFFAIPCSGCLSNAKAQLANFLVGNPLEYPLLEMNLIPCCLEFLTPATIAITGDNFNFKINDNVIPLNQSIDVSAGDKLVGKPVRNSNLGYIAIQGKINGQSHYNSMSTLSIAQLGGINGQALVTNDIITLTNDTPHVANRSISEYEKNHNTSFNICKGPEYDLLDNTSKQKLQTHTFKISSSSNRMGARLEGNKLLLTQPRLTHSVPVLPGFIQLPPSGQPIVLLKDGQTTGGYARIAYLDNNNFESFCEIGVGAEIRFRIV